MSKYNVFLSRANSLTKDYEKSVNTLTSILSDRDIKTITIGQNESENDNPINTIRKRMSDCSGLILFGTPQELIQKGIYKPNIEGQFNIEDEKRSTIWNQIEGSMGFMLHLPIMIIVDKGINEGLFAQNVLPSFKLEYDLKKTDWSDSKQFKDILNSFIDQMDK